MNHSKLIAVVGMGAILPDAFDVDAFWKNILDGRYSIGDVPADRWDQNLYFDPDPAAPDKTYSKIGAFVKGYRFDPFKHGIAIPPTVLATLDGTQQWAIAASQQALKDYGYPERKLDPERVAVIFGNANAGEGHYRSTFRILAPEYNQALAAVPEFQSLPAEVREAILAGALSQIRSQFKPITEDTMPGELSNIIAGRVANVFNFSGPNYVTDAACASSLAAMQNAISGLVDDKFDAVLTGGIDRNMGPESYIKFSKIGALSADGSRPYADGANGFVMGEGAVVFLLKRLADAERDGDRIYAVIRGIGGSSDGKGKGITAPNPLGQQRAIERAWKDAGLSPESAGLVEGHGTSTRVGDLAEVNSLNAIFGNLGIRNQSIVLGSVKSNIGHLKSAAGAVGLLKAILALHHQVLPPTVNFQRPNPNIDFEHLPFRVITGAQEWPRPTSGQRFGAVSSFGFGGTNFHVVLEEYAPGLSGSAAPSTSIPERIVSAARIEPAQQVSISVADSSQNYTQIREHVMAAVSEKTGYPVEMLDPELDLEADLGIDTVKQAELFAAIRAHYGIPRREDLRLSDYNTLAKVAGFVEDALNAGQGGASPAPAQPTAAEAAVAPAPAADGELRPYQGLFFASAATPAELKQIIQKQAEELKNGQPPTSRCPSPTELAHPERIAIDYASHEELAKRLERALAGLEAEKPATWKSLQAHGIYRGSGKPGKVAFLFPGQGSQYVNMLLDLRDDEPLVKETFDEADRVMTPILGRPLTSFIYTNGSEEELKQAEQELKNTAITQPAMLTANVAVMRVLNKYGIQPDLVIGHSLGEYAALVAAGVLTFAEALEVVSARGREMARIKVDDPGCMAAVSAPLQKVEEVIRSIDDYVVIANINSPVQCVLGGTTRAIDAAIARFTAEEFQAVKIPVSHAFHTRIVAPASAPLREVIARMNVQTPKLPIVANVTGELYPTDREDILDILAGQVASPVQFVKGMQKLVELGARVFIESGPKRVLNALAADNLKDREDVAIIATNHPRKGGKASFNEALCGIYAAGIPAVTQTVQTVSVPDVVKPVAADIFPAPGGYQPVTGSVVITGLGLGLPGKDKHVFDDSNFERILAGDQRIENFSDDTRRSMLAKHVTRLVKSDAGAVMQEITDLDQVLKLGGLSGAFDPIEEFGIPGERVESLDISSQLAMAAGIEALRDAGIPLVMSHRRTSKGTYLPDRWKLPESMQAETGVIFGSAFPGLNRMAEESERYFKSEALEKQLQEVNSTIELVHSLHPTGQTQLINELERRRLDLQSRLKEIDYHFDRRFVFRILAMGHSQFAEYIGARGPNAHANAACATTTHAVSIAEDWIRSGRCRRVIVISGDDVTNDTLVQWIGTSLFASGAATTEANLRLAAIPFDKRRNGMIMGMGAAALVIESEDAARERGVRGIGEILATHTANSAFHGTRLDVQHVGEVMDQLLRTAERRFGINRAEIAARTVFMSHETYTPARGGSASAEIHALRSVFGDQANRVIIANTKGFTGHSMGVGIEDVVVTRALETGIVPPIAHIQDGFEPDPDLGDLNLSHGGKYDPQYALRLGAGFGSQIAMTLVRRIPGEGERIQQQIYQPWLAAAAGYDRAELETVQRTLRIKSQGVPVREPARSTWDYGQIPVMRAAVEGGAAAPAALPVQTVIARPIQITQPAPAATAPAATSSNQEIQAHVLAVVSEKTGYPAEMLDLDLDLEADLGIDTVKQAELFAAIRTHYGIPRREDLRLSDYNTLAKVIGFVEGGLAQQPQAEIVPPTAPGQLPSEGETSPAADDEIKAHVLAVVSEKTGYPAEMLDLDLDLEADLGIDTVKQAELFAAIRSHYGIPRREDLRLSDYNTLAKVIGFVETGLAQQPQAETAAPAAPASQPEPESSPVQPLTLRRPTPVLLPRVELDKPTGIELQDKQIVIVADLGKTAAALQKKLKAEKASAIVVDVSEAGSRINDLAASGSLAGVYLLAGLDADPQWNGSAPDAWMAARRSLSAALLQIGQALPAGAFLISATRMGGLQGIQNVSHPLGGLVSGFTKALRRERPDSLMRTVDFEINASAGFIADRLLAETRHDSVNFEIGYEGELRFGFSLREQITAVETAAALPADGVYVVSGGTGGITSAILTDLARNGAGSFYLLGRTALPARSDTDLALLSSDRNALRLKIQQTLSAAVEKATPAAVENKLSALERAAATLRVMDEIVRCGGKAYYLTCDVTERGSVEQAVAEIKRSEKKVDVLIHAAGMEKSRKIESKTEEEFQSTIAVKADGLMHLLGALESQALQPGAVVSFSSVAGRFGNAGQTDYSAANDFLSKMAAWLPTRYPGMQAVTIDWGAWAEVGMASRGSIPMLMERARIEMLAPAAAAPVVRTVLANGIAGEVLAAGALGALLEPTGPDCGLDIPTADAALRAANGPHTMYSHLAGFDLQNGIRLEAELDPDTTAYLRDHAINGIPVLPGVIGIEGFSVAARQIASVLASESARFEIDRLENIHFLAPFKFYGNKPRTIQWNAAAYRLPEGLKIEVRLESDLTRHNGSVEHLLHFTGDVYLTTGQPASSTARAPRWAKKGIVPPEDIYRLYFHGPSFQVLEGVQHQNGLVLGRFNKKLVEEAAGLTTPLLIELCFQTAGLFEAGATGILALPRSIGSLRLYRQPVNGATMYAEVQPRETDGQYSFDARVVDAHGNVFLELRDYQTSPLPYRADNELIEPLKILLPFIGTSQN